LPHSRDYAVRLVALVCVAQVLAQIGAYTWPALLPGFIDDWGISNSEAGWITASFYLAYVLAVPVLVSATDWIDPKRIYLLGVGCTVASHAGFALLAEGPWSACGFRMLAGIGWAGTYMTGLKLLADRVDGRLMSRATAGHAASLGVSGALSFVIAGGAGALWGWEAAFWLAAACAAAAWLIALVFAPWQAPKPADPDLRRFDFGPVLRNRSSLAYGIAYCVHTWEMNAVRGWAVAFLAWVAADSAGGPVWLAPTVAAAAMGLVGTGASVLGNEASIRLGRRRLIRLAMGLSIVIAAGIGFLGPFDYGLAVVLVLAYGVVIWLDSSSLTAGAAGTAAPGRRGATLAMHSMLGYAGGFVGPLAIGLVLDLAGVMSRTGWGLAFLHIAAVMLAGRIAFALLRPAGLAGDREG
jgi:MFS family permease